MPVVGAWELPAASSFKFYPVKSGNTIILPSKYQSGDCILAVDVRTGKKLWSVRDSAFKDIYYNCTPLIRGSSFLLPVKNQLFCINISSGLIEWKDKRPEAGENHIFGFGNWAFRTYRKKESNTAQFVEFDIRNGESRVIDTLSLRNISTSVVRSPVPLIRNTATILMAGITDYIPQQGANSFLLFWDLNSPEVKIKFPVFYGDKQGRGPTHHPIVSNNLSFWNIDKEVLCYDVLRRAVCWRTTLPASMLTSRMVSDGIKLYAACEDGTLYAIELETGKIIWKCKISSTPGRVFIVQNKIFLIGGQDRSVYEIALDDGRLLRKFWFKEEYGALERVSCFFESGAVVSNGQKWYSFNPERPNANVFKVKAF